MVSTDIGVWIGSFFIIAIYSFLWKRNPLSQFATSTVIGAAVAHTTLMAIQNINKVAISGLTGGNFVYILPIVLGLLLYSRFVKNYEYLSRYGMAVLIGTFVGVNLGPEIVARFINQIKGSITPLFSSDPLTTINSILIVVLTFSTVVYFIFDRALLPGENIHSPLQKIGRLALSISLGYYLGNTFMTRFAFVLNRLQYLFYTWLGLG
jgi:hypothetical protein